MEHQTLIRIGTSGFSYKEWVGPFYPPKTPAARMLSLYAAEFGAVEINYTFRALPRAAMLEGWAAQTPPGFRFSLKAPQRITHYMRLRGTAELAARFTDAACALDSRLGPALFQLAPDFRADHALLRDFTSALDPRMRAAFEFRHSSWLDDATFEILRDARCALCIAQTEDWETPVIATADFVYLRLRKGDYSDRELADWGSRLIELAAGGAEVYAYLKHDLKAPELARGLQAAIASETGPR